jgi:hypothetical protein
LFRAKEGLYCGAAVDMSQPLLPMGMKTPMSILATMVAVWRDDSFSKLWRRTKTEEVNRERIERQRDVLCGAPLP